MIQVTAKGGPLNGKRFDVADDAEQLDPHPGVTGGHYKVNQVTATWQADAKAKTAARRRTAAKPKPPVETTVLPSNPSE